MRYALLITAALLSACTSAVANEAGTTAASSALTADTTLTFAADFTATASSPLVSGTHVRVTYDPARLTACRGDLNGGPGWSITGFYRINGGTIGSFEAGGLSPSHGTNLPIIALSAPGDLAMWFENNSAWGCDAFDSAYGNNYHFTIAPAANAPGWIGNAVAVTSRQTCGNGSYCESDFRPLDAGFTFDTWTRERAAITKALFEVWKQGTTDFDNADLWKELDVELHARAGGTGDFVTTYVPFDRRVGNNARYAIDLRALDPVPNAPGGGALTSRDQCPAFPLTRSADGQYVQATVEFFMTVNGVELRPAGGGVYEGTYANYAGLYAICDAH